MSKEELLAREKARQAKGQPAQTESYEEKVGKVEEQLAEYNERMESLQSVEHRSTGHVRHCTLTW